MIVETTFAGPYSNATAAAAADAGAGVLGDEDEAADHESYVGGEWNDGFAGDAWNDGVAASVSLPFGNAGGEDGSYYGGGFMALEPMPLGSYVSEDSDSPGAVGLCDLQPLSTDSSSRTRSRPSTRPGDLQQESSVGSTPASGRGGKVGVPGDAEGACGGRVSRLPPEQTGVGATGRRPAPARADTGGTPWRRVPRLPLERAGVGAAGRRPAPAHGDSEGTSGGRVPRLPPERAGVVATGRRPAPAHGDSKGTHGVRVPYLPPERVSMGMDDRRSGPARFADVVPDWVHVKDPGGGGYRTVLRVTPAQVRARGVPPGAKIVWVGQDNNIRDLDASNLERPECAVT